MKKYIDLILLILMFTAGYISGLWYAEQNPPEPQIIYIEKEQEEEIELVNLGEFEVTAYCSCKKCCGVWAENRPKDENGNDIVYTASGAVAKPNHTIAVDTDVIPFWAEVIIDGHTYTAEDTGGKVKGKVIDIYFSDHEAAKQFGRQTHEVYAPQ